ncbi:FG-GAP-like repeat-containing protein [uncultured Victivallis sp.]|uniref:FG-GAP repeat domain-containing protein n=1 Tax=uncultured Victivallis sp. TaxID=354118 RepID=UPI0025DAEAF5|nr:FG-GAP-like repeat-containing protein [uncultured Victivallis sp.]
MYAPICFQKQLIALEKYESTAFIDVNRDGVMDIVSGAWWYEGPDFKTKHRIYQPRSLNDYFEDFSTIALDITGNGYPDIVTGGYFAGELVWLENPGREAKEWNVHRIPFGNIETTLAADLDGDGELEILPNNPGGPMTVFRKENGNLIPYELYAGPQNHGLGVGDLAGNGRNDIVLIDGWLENPGTLAGPWKFHPDFHLSDSGSVPMLVEDINGDGKPEIIAGNAHNYGLNWWEKTASGWVSHAIDPYNSQYHCMRWVDIDGDGEKELVTGKRFMAHLGNDPGEYDPVGIVYFKWTAGQFVKQVIDYGYEPPLSGKGSGIQFDLTDLDGKGYLSLIAPGKDGLYLYRNLGPSGRNRK